MPAGRASQKGTMRLDSGGREERDGDGRRVGKLGAAVGTDCRGGL